jgi:hypothetical protein
MEQRAKSMEQRAKGINLYALCFTLCALCSTLFFCSHAYAEGPSAMVNVNYTDTKEFEDGRKNQASSNFNQNYYFRLDNSVTPVLSYQINLRSTLTDSRVTDEHGYTTATYLRAMEPALDIFLRNPAYGLEGGYRRLEQWSTAHLSEDSRKTTDYYYSRINLTPYALPSLSLQFDRQNNYDHLSQKQLDTEYTRYSGSSWYNLLYKDLKFSYNLSYVQDENKDNNPADVVSKTRNNSFNGVYNLGYSRSFWQGNVNVSAGYQGNYVRSKTEQDATQTGSVSIVRKPSLGMYGLGTEIVQTVDTLISTITLSDTVYDIPVTTNTGAVNIGQNGKKYYNMGIQLYSSTKPVDIIYIYVNKDITSDTNLINNTSKWRAYRSDFNLPATWTEITIQNVTISAYDIRNNIFRYEIRFSTPQSGLYYRIINLDNASISDVLVTEIEAYGTDIIPQSGKITDTSTFFAQGINLNVNIKPVKKVTVLLNYFLNRSDQNPESLFNSISGAFSNIFTKPGEEKDAKLQSNITRSYGVSTVWLTHLLLTTTVRFQRNEAFDNKKTIDMRSDTYSLAFQSSPLPTLDANLSFIRTYSYDFNEKYAMNNLYLLTVGSKLYKDVNMITDIGYTQSRTYPTDVRNPPETETKDTETSTRYVRGTIDARFTQTLSGNLSYGLSRASGTDSLSSHDGTLIMTYRPGRFFSLSGNLKISDTDVQTTISEGIFIDWLFLPAVRMNAGYQHLNTKQESLTNDSFSGYLIWYITRFLDLQVTYNYLRELKEQKRETYMLSGNLTCRFW